MSSGNSYQPRRGGLAWQVIEFLTTNPEETLQTEDIAIKWDYNLSGVHTALGPAVLFGMLKRSEEDGEITYRLGTGCPSITAKPGSHPTLRIASGPLRARPGSTAEAIAVAQQLEGIEPEQGIPVPDAKRLTPQALIRKKLRTLKPGESIPIPIDLDVRTRGVIKDMQKAGEGEFTKHVIDERFVRVWRIK